ncbi:aldehyde dehydrogenase family protein [Algisphaera agarilytica]|uniref:Acyl-CoA reductase-like NAD-dependent aldehyde dehydrogenase n=1 Tax=Algisphaera agarilytica TaxID=1385975 RepID=A0A7X0LJU9_9BACT|nr:aldehyde dehydrogenase family protein [Algisphaera agarilytica]MBB6428971.1 acyl-CoA reductase-like NAD-dependent aldehyde dehydrogenase [Algisphaera agarilytica]
MTHDSSATSSWSSLPLKQRVQLIGGLRHVLADQSERFIAPLRALSTRSHDSETLAAEVLPLAEACGWIAQNATKLLRPQKLGGRGRPRWLWGVASEIHREPMGNVLIIAPGNFPLFLPGVQVVQALAAGNRVWVKPSPGPGCVEIMRELAAALHELGLPEEALTVTGTDPSELDALYPAMDKVFLTGSETTGKLVQAKCAEHSIPCVMELSGCDAVVVLTGADVELAAKCIAFGLTLNGSATCIAPRRVFVEQGLHDRLVDRLRELLAETPATPIPPRTRDLVNGLLDEVREQGGEVHGESTPLGDTMKPVVVTGVDATCRLLQTDVFAPVVSVVPVADGDEALREASRCGYRLGASVFGPDREAYDFATRIDAGCVVVNDVIVPTADPRLPFAGRGRSGFGATRGADGLLEMTRVKAITARRWKLHPHLRPTDATTVPILRALLRMSHAKGVAARVKAGCSLLTLSRRNSSAQDQE